MKNILKISFLSFILVFASCKDRKKYKEIDSTDSLNQQEIVSKEKTAPTKFSPAIDSIVEDYLKIKNALVENNSTEAATAGKTLLVTLSNMNTDSLDPKLKNQYDTIVSEAKKHVENIKSNSKELDVQRMNFSELSGDINNLIMIFGTNKKLYQDYCPMYNKGTTGFWISEMKDIKNPYYGSEMLTCGIIKKEF